MAAKSPLDELAERKRLLTLQADLHRQLLTAELESFHSQLESAREGIRTGSPWMLGGVLAAGLVAARHWRAVAKWAPAAWGAWQWFRRTIAR